MTDDHKVGEQVDAIVARRGSGGDAVIPILQDIQKAFHWLPEEALRQVCASTGISASRIAGVSTFYTQFRHRPAGRHTLRICTGTACHVKGATQVYEAFRRELKLAGTQDTDSQGLFTVEKVACLGCCTIAPVIRIDEMTYGNVAPDKVREILDDFLAQRTGWKKDGLPAGHARRNRQGEIRIGLGSCCVASGSAEVRAELKKALEETRINVDVKQVGCVGLCHQVPALEIIKPGETATFYTRVKPGEVKRIVWSHFRPGNRITRFKAGFIHLVERFLHDGTPGSSRPYSAGDPDTPVSEFLSPQQPIATENRGVLRPTDLTEYLQRNGFEALRKCLLQMTPQEVTGEITRSGLRGRGGAGFPTGEKWNLVSQEKANRKTVICNGDEGDPGAFMDRMLLESYPFRVLEGMIIAAYATGASEGLFYIRAEYPLAVARINEALEKCRLDGLLGNNILGSGFSFDARVFEGAGAFVCGEETALIASVEGYRGHPRVRPPYPSTSGLHGAPTLVNNTETFAFIPWIIRSGAGNFARIGINGSRGTKVFALAGKVNRGGLIEVPMGMSIRRVVEEIGHGIPNGKAFKAVQIGGPSGGCIPASLADLTIDFEALTEVGSMMGSGGMVVLDETDCMVDIAHYFLSFTQNQSCGKCTFCRIGTRRMLEMLEKIRFGKGTQEDLKTLEHLSGSVKRGSLCGLGKTAPNPVLSILTFFREEVEAHLSGRCPAGKCTPLIRYSINDSCIGCTLCAQHCPSGAIAFRPYEKHSVDPEKCIKCNSCRQVCPEQAVDVT